MWIHITYLQFLCDARTPRHINSVVSDTNELMHHGLVGPLELKQQPHSQNNWKSLKNFTMKGIWLWRLTWLSRGVTGSSRLSKINRRGGTSVLLKSNSEASSFILCWKLDFSNRNQQLVTWKQHCKNQKSKDTQITVMLKRNLITYKLF